MAREAALPVTRLQFDSGKMDASGLETSSERSRVIRKRNEKKGQSDFVSDLEPKPHVFKKQKAECLKGLDMSRKGSFDAPIQDLIAMINEQEHYFTTSSCSGRIAVVEYPPAVSVKKEGCRWLLMSHEPCTADAVKEAVKKSEGDASFKFEAFVIHVQCASLHHAQMLLAEAVASGHRNSGVSLSKKGKVVVGVRSTHSLEIPLTHEGNALVTDQYLEYITELANKKMAENQVRINRFTKGFESILVKLVCEEQPEQLSNNGKSKSNRAAKNTQNNTTSADNSVSVLKTKMESTSNSTKSNSSASHCDVNNVRTDLPQAKEEQNSEDRSLVDENRAMNIPI